MHKPPARRGFTLVELLVAMTLTIFILVILSEAFTKGLDTFSGLKGIGDMNENLRSAGQVLRQDLAQDHYTGKRRISDAFWSVDPPREGFINAGHVPGTVSGGNDVDGLPVIYTAEGILHLTVKRRGNRRADFFSSPWPSGLVDLAATPTNPVENVGDGVQRDNNNIFTSQWAEVMYYLEKTGTTVEPLNAASTLGTPLYALYRKQYLIVPDPKALNALNRPVAEIDNFAHIACIPNPANPNVLYFPAPEELGNPSLRTATHAASSPSRGRSLVIPNVLLFTVEVQGVSAPDFVFQNFNASTANITQGIKAFRISLRVFDQGTQQARQMTLIQDL